MKRAYQGHSRGWGVALRECSEFIIRGGGTFAGGGVPVSNSVSKGDEYFAKVPRYTFFTPTNNKKRKN